MAFAEIYKRQVALLIRVLPLVTEEACFALKGGTAINLFVRDLPRLSVDIDLTLFAGSTAPGIPCRHRRRDEAHWRQDKSHYS